MSAITKHDREHLPAHDFVGEEHAAHLRILVLPLVYDGLKRKVTRLKLLLQKPLFRLAEKMTDPLAASHINATVANSI